MIKLAFRADGRQTFLLGLTDVNLQRLGSRTSDGSITVRLAELLPPEWTFEPDAELLIFFATRHTCVQLAEVVGVEPHVLLNMLGEG